MTVTRAFLLIATLATPALAQDLASADAIRTAVTGNAVQGSMLDSSAYTEFYAADSTIHGDGYEGAWTLDGDEMCFAYGEDPTTCWQLRRLVDQVAWVQDGAARGTSTLVPGNPNGF